MQKAGLRNLHGLRHAYAQRRYKELTEWEAPINGGPNSRQLTSERKRNRPSYKDDFNGGIGAWS